MQLKVIFHIPIISLTKDLRFAQLRSIIRTDICRVLQMPSYALIVCKFFSVPVLLEEWAEVVKSKTERIMFKIASNMTATGEH